jgi:hypothetical protein
MDSKDGKQLVHDCWLLCNLHPNNVNKALRSRIAGAEELDAKWMLIEPFQSLCYSRLLVIVRAR